MPVRPRWSDDVSTEVMPVHETPHHAAHRRREPPMWLMKALFIGVTIAAVAASVIVALQMSHRSTDAAATVDARQGDCLTWPPGTPERASTVDCGADHLFEVASSEAMPSAEDPGSPAAEAERQKICQQAVGSYLGPRYDPGGRFVVGAVWTPGRLVCGLQLPSDGVASAAFKGKVAEQDQSRVWPTGTCLGIRSGETTDIPVDCGLPHALEITGTFDLSSGFGQATAPATAAQDAIVRDACNTATTTYLAPVPLESTGLAVRYEPIDAAGWAAGSRRIACRIGAPKPGGGWSTLVRSAKNGVRIDGQPAGSVPAPVAPPPPPPVAPPVEAAAPVVEEADPTTDEPEPSQAAEVPVRVTRDTEQATTSTAEAQPQPVPHMDGSEGLGPIPHMDGSAAPGPVPHLVGPDGLNSQPPGPATVAPSPQPVATSTSAAP